MLRTLDWGMNQAVWFSRSEILYLGSAICAKGLCMGKQPVAVKEAPLLLRLNQFIE
jgi:hypothetical protein